MATGPCPSAEALEAFADAPRIEGEAPGPVARHLDSCAECRAAVAEIRENNRFLTGFVAELSSGRTEVAPGAPTPDEAPVAPDLVPGYRILEEIHRGGQGIVYRAVQIQTQRTVAIKMLLKRHGSSGREQERFEREARMAAALHHPNIVTIYDSGYIAGGRYGLAMEYVEGATLDGWSRSLNTRTGRGVPRRNLQDRLRVMAKVCDAVLCAHQHAIVHRDLKPANILVDSSGEPHVLDFGIAHQTGTDERARLTHTGEFAGTLAYASPEQVAGDPAKVDTRTDIYSLGVILYELVSGRLPYDVKGPLALAIRHIEATEPVPPPVDTDVATIILKAMAKDPARRYATVAGLRNDIQRCLAGEPIEARRDHTWYVLLKGLRKHRGAVAAAAGLLLALLLGLAGIVYGMVSSREAHLREQIEKQRSADAARRAQAVAIVLQEVLPPRDGGPYGGSDAPIARGLSDITTALDTGWLASRPALAADVQEVLTDIYRARQTRSGWEAEMAARNAKLLNSGLYGPDDPRTLASAHNEASAMFARGRLADAERLARGNLERRIPVLGPGHPDVTASRGLLAEILLSLGRATDAEAECLTALAAAGDEDEGSLQTAGVRRTYAAALLKQGRPDPAGRECIAALRIHCVESRDINPEIAADLRLLADVFAGAPPGAEWSSPVMLAIERQWPRPDDALRRLASAVAGGGGGAPPLVDALPELLALKMRTMPDQPLELAETHALLGRALIEASAAGDRPARRRLRAAGAHFMEAAHILEETIGPDRIAVANCYDVAAEACWDCDTSLAARATRRSVRIWRAQPPERQDQAQLATQERGAGDMLTIAGQYDEAEEHYKIALRDFEMLMGDQSYVVATTYTRYGEMLRQAGRLREAEAAARRGFEVGRKSAAAPLDQRMYYAVVLGRVEADLGRLDRAESLLLQALGMISVNGDARRGSALRNVGGALANVSLRRGDLAGARWWRCVAASGLFCPPPE